MMVEFKWISLFLTAVLQFTAAAEKLPLSFTVRVGDDVTLPCENVIDGQQKCEYTTWTFSGSGSSSTVELVKLGQIGENAKSKSDRLSVTENCSLVIKKVTDEDVGRYDCQQYTSGGKQAPDSLVHLSVIIMTERKEADKVTLNCSVSKHGQSCRHTVKWLYEGKDVDKDMKTSQSDCYAAVSFLDSHFSYKSKSNLKCEVTDGSSGKVQLFIFSPQSSATTTTKPTTTKPATTTTKPATTTTTTTKPTTTKPATTATTKPATTKPATSKPTTTTKPATPKPATTTTTEPATTKPATTTTTTKPATTTENTKSQGWLWFVAVAALLITVVIVVGFIRWKKTKGKKPQMDENTADPEDGVSYASISYTRKTNSKGRVLGKDGDDEDDAVTYSSVKASSSSAGASADPSDLYATVNKPNK